MKIQKSQRKSNKKFLFTVLVILVLLLVAGLAYAYTIDAFPFKKNTDNTLTNDGINDQPQPLTEDEKATAKPEQDTMLPKPDKNIGDSYIDTPVGNKPSVDASYPVTNSHYKIVQIRKNSYEITLYPIANNPNYSNYDTQLSAYKKEALDYLKKRYGNISNFNFTWSPEGAKNA